MGKLDIGEINFHDNYITSIFINRSDPGNKDTVVIIIETDSDKYVLNFKKIYQVKLNMPTFFSAPEYINWTRLSDNDEEMLECKAKLEKVGASLPDLKCYEINLNMSDGQIKIFFTEIEVIKSSLLSN